MSKYIYYKHIHDFCNELADLWTTYAPKMRFSQILVGLNKASDRPQQRTYELEETEMMDAIRHFFKNPYQKSKEDDNQCENLTERWEDVRENFVLDGEYDVFDLTSLTTLLKETWQYFINTADCFGFDNASLSIIGSMYVLLYHGDYPENIKPWQYDAYLKILEGILQTLNKPLDPIIGRKDNFIDGFIGISEWGHHTIAFHISEFDDFFAELSKEYYERDYM